MQHDYTVVNAPGQGVRQSINTALHALASHNSGENEPTVTFPFMPWAHPAADVLKIRNAANTGWIDLYTLSTGEPLQVNLTGAVRYKGNWDASTGQLPSDPESGHTYRISVPGALPVIGAVSVSDSIIYNGTGWDHWDHTDQVTAVAGLMGAIAATDLIDALLGSTGAGSKIRVALQSEVGNLTGVNAAQLEGNDWQAVLDAISSAVSAIDFTLTTVDVLAAVAGGGIGEIGTYAFLRGSSISASFNQGSTYSGSSLRYSGITRWNYGGQSEDMHLGGGAPPGTWRCMGDCDAGKTDNGYGGYAWHYASTLFMRIS